MGAMCHFAVGAHIWISLTQVLFIATFDTAIIFEILGNGDVAKWLNALVCKISSARTRQFESDRHLQNSKF